MKDGLKSLEFKILHLQPASKPLLEITMPYFRFKDSSKVRLNKVRLSNIAMKAKAMEESASNSIA